MQQERFWSRVGHWFKASRKPNGKEGIELGEDPPGPGRGLVADYAAEDMATATKVEDAIIPRAGVRASRRELSLERLQEGYDKVVKLVESIQEHLEVQDRRSESMTRSLSEMADRLARVSETSQGELDTLATISEQMEASAVRSKKRDEQLAQLPRIADAQRETMASIGRQLDASNQASDRTVTSLDGFQSAVSTLAEATGDSTAALHEMHADSTAREERLAGLLESQTRRFTWLACIAAVVVLIAAAVGAVALLT